MKQRKPCSVSGSVFVWALILSNLLVFQLTSNRNLLTSSFLKEDMISFAPSVNSVIVVGNALDFTGEAVALPSVRVQEADADNVDEKRQYYGGKGDKPHLGGFAANSVDMNGVSPATWKLMVEKHGIKSILDIGCGRGVSTSWFYTHGLETYCVEGSHDAIQQSLLPPGIVTEHDFSRGPWWPSKTVDAVWCVELLEHVGRNFHKNLMPAFRKAALVYATHSVWGGWHHVEVHDEAWWITKFQSYGFVYSEQLTKEARAVAEQNRDMAPNGETYNAQHIWLTLLVFINPTVASMPKHHHILSEHGCWEGNQDGKMVHYECGTKKEQMETPISDDFLPLTLNPEMDYAWEKLVFGNTSQAINDA